VKLPLYDRIGTGYGHVRRTDPRIAAQLWAALGDARTVVNVGAGTGSYEPPHLQVTAVEPSAVMRAQRPADAAHCVAASAESLPFDDKSFDAAMAVLSDHLWRDPLAGLRELRRVARRVVVFQFDNRCFPQFWLCRDYLPEVARFAGKRPTLTERAEAINARMDVVPIRWDCLDGFFHAYWRRPGCISTRSAAVQRPFGHASGAMSNAALLRPCAQTSSPDGGRSEMPSC
jgi:SAM-dependent methyltransferase